MVTIGFLADDPHTVPTLAIWFRHQMVRAGMNLALDQGYEAVFAATVMAARILERLGWEFIKTVTHQDGELSLNRCKL